MNSLAQYSAAVGRGYFPDDAKWQNGTEIAAILRGYDHAARMAATYCRAFAMRGENKKDAVKWEAVCVTLESVLCLYCYGSDEGFGHAEESLDLGSRL